MAEARYIALSDIIAQGIASGRWTGRLPGVRKLGEELSADPATLAKAFRLLADKGIVTIQGTKGTFATMPGQRVRNNVIGIVGITTNKLIQDREMDVMEREAAKGGFRLMVLAHNNTPFLDDAKLLLKFPVDGYIFMYSSLTFEMAAALREHGVGFVSCNMPVGIPGAPWVDFDMPGALETAMLHLAKLGRKRIAYVEYCNPNYRYSERMLESYRRALDAAALPFDKDFFISRKQPAKDGHRAEMLFSFGCECAKELLVKGKVPDAAVFSCLDMGRGFLAELKRSGACAEDIPTFSYCSKLVEAGGMSTIEYDYCVRASAAVKMLVNLIADPMSDDRQLLIKGELAPRGGCLLTGNNSKCGAGAS